MPPIPFEQLNSEARAAQSTEQALADDRQAREQDTLSEAEAFHFEQMRVAGEVEDLMEKFEDEGRRNFTPNPRSQEISGGMPRKTRAQRKLAAKMPHGVLGFEEHATKLLPLGEVDPTAPPEQAFGYVEFTVTKAVQLTHKHPGSRSLHSSNIARMETDTLEFGARIFTGPNGLAHSTDTEGLVQRKEIVQLNGDLESKMADEPDSTKPALPQIVRATPNSTLLPSPDLITDAEILASPQAASIPQQVLRDPALLSDYLNLHRAQLAAGVRNHELSQPNAKHAVITGNVMEHFSTEAEIVEYIDQLTQMVDAQLNPPPPPAPTPPVAP